MTLFMGKLRFRVVPVPEYTSFARISGKPQEQQTVSDQLFLQGKPLQQHIHIAHYFFQKHGITITKQRFLGGKVALKIPVVIPASVQKSRMERGS